MIGSHSPRVVRERVARADRREVVALPRMMTLSTSGSAPRRRGRDRSGLLDALDDGAELDADPVVGADDEPAAVGGRDAHESAMRGARRRRPHLGEGIRLDDARDRLVVTRLSSPFAAGASQQLERIARPAAADRGRRCRRTRSR